VPIEAIRESTTTRKAGGLDFTAVGGKRQGREVPQSLKTTRWNRGFSCEAPGLENPNIRLKSNACIYLNCLQPSITRLLQPAKK